MNLITQISIGLFFIFAVCFFAYIIWPQDVIFEGEHSKGGNGADGSDGVDGRDGRNYLLTIPGRVKNGIDGIDGIDGSQGEHGTNGIDGVTGPQGDTGPQGSTGPEGYVSSSVIYVGDLNTKKKTYYFKGQEQSF